jgi:hypothetical protein
MLVAPLQIATVATAATTGYRLSSKAAKEFGSVTETLTLVSVSNDIGILIAWVCYLALGASGRTQLLLRGYSSLLNAVCCIAGRS